MYVDYLYNKGVLLAIGNMNKQALRAKELDQDYTIIKWAEPIF